ncbi:MAG TPA: MFS transporter [Ktedonobacteraceae bacterium]|nr:MFS transporter [Ktedonobacteraceae bacterium]
MDSLPRNSWKTNNSKIAHRSIIPLLLGTFILRVNGGASSIVLGRFLAQLSTQNGHAISYIHVGLISVAYYIVELTLAPVLGAVSDRIGRRIFLTVGPLFGLVQVALLIFTPTHNPFPYLLSLQVLAGISSAMQVPAVLGYLADFTVEDQSLRMRVMSLYELATSGGLAVGVVLGGFAWDRFERYAFALLATGYLLAALCMFVVPAVKQVIERGKVRALASRYWRIIRTPRLFTFIPAWISINALVGIWLSSQLTFILSSPHRDRHQLLMGSLSQHGGGGHLSLILGAYVLFFGLCLLFWAFFMNRVPRLLLMLSSIVGVYLACIALAGLNHTGTGNMPLLVVWIALLFVGVFAESSFAPAALAYLADISEGSAKDRGLLMGLYSVFLGVGQLLGNGLGGVFAQGWGFDGLIFLTFILAFIALLCLLLLSRIDKRSASPRLE